MDKINPTEKRTVFVTGAAGLLGNHLSRHLLSLGFTVVGIDNLSGGYKDFLPTSTSFHFLHTDLLDSTTLDRAYKDYSPVATFHFAAYAAEGLSPFIRKYNYTNNLVASASVINACIENDSKLIFASSMAVYGDQEPPFSETMRPSPIDPYGIAKYAVELDLQVAKEQFGLRFSIVRPHNVVGKYQNIWDRYRNVLGIFIRKSLAGESLPIFGTGEQTRAFSDVSFYMTPFTKLIDSYDGETFNIGADNHITILELAKKVQSRAQRNGLEVSISHLEPRHEAKNAFCDHSKAKRDLGFNDQTNLDDLIEMMFEWAEHEKPRDVQNFQYEINKNLYGFWK